MPASRTLTLTPRALVELAVASGSPAFACRDWSVAVGEQRGDVSSAEPNVRARMLWPTGEVQAVVELDSSAQ